MRLSRNGKNPLDMIAGEIIVGIRTRLSTCLLISSSGEAAGLFVSKIPFVEIFYKSRSRWGWMWLRHDKWHFSLLTWPRAIPLYGTYFPWAIWIYTIVHFLFSLSCSRASQRPGGLANKTIAVERATLYNWHKIVFVSIMFLDKVISGHSLEKMGGRPYICIVGLE